MRMPCAAFLTILVAACSFGSPPPDGAPLPQAIGTIMYLGLELPDAGTPVGGHYSGASYETRQASYLLADGARVSLSSQARLRGEILLRAAGLSVRGLSSSSDAQQLYGVQYGLSGRVQTLNVRTTGAAEPFRVDAQALVVWELLDLGSGDAVFGRSVPGALREVGDLYAVIGGALDASLEHLLADSLFRRALATPRADPDEDIARFTREIPGPGEFIVVAPGDLRPSGEADGPAKIGAGLVTLYRQNEVYGTAFILTRDGLAISVSRSTLRRDRVRARLPSGVDRPVRLIRSHRGLDVALLQIPCPGECTTVDWDAPNGVAVHTQVLAVGAPLREGDGILVTTGRVGGRWGVANGITLEGMPDQLEGGEAVAWASSSRVFGMVSVRRGRRVVLMLDEVLRALRVRMETMPPRAAGAAGY